MTMSQPELTFQQAKNLASIEQKNRNLIRWWLYLIALMVGAMVVVGGATRLTDSGLSITEWKPLLGIFPPFSHADWLMEFEKYKQIPEYHQINKGMSLEDFKFIYWWEWSHRFLGRMIGFVVFIPMAFFWVTGRIEPVLKPRLVFLFLLGALQGFVGWWMVASGLVERTDVSQYRLATHLTLAAIIFSYAIWLARGLVRHSDVSASATVRTLAPLMVIMVLFQLFLGGLVAGLDAGFAFNDWPKMDGAWVPTGLLILEPNWLNFFENPKTVQFVHRIGAYVLVGVIVLNWLLSHSPATGNTHRRRAQVLLILALGQATLGVLTLIWQVPLFWALAHQAGAIIVLMFAVAHWRGFVGSYRPHTAVEMGG